MSLWCHARHSGIYGTTNPSLASYMSSKLMNLEPSSTSTSDLQSRVHVARYEEFESILHRRMTYRRTVRLPVVFHDPPSSSNTHLLA